ncbi:MAG: hypothetical protein ACREH9_10625, partial [Pseudomonadota bacterium]
AGVVAGTVAVVALLAASITSFYSVRAVREERSRAERQLVDADLRMGDLLARAGNRFEALDRYREALTTAGRARGPGLLSAFVRTSALEAELGDAPAALETDRRFLQLAEKTPGAEADVALGHERAGRLLGSRAGIAELRQAVELYRQLPAGRAGLAQALSGLAQALSDTGQTTEAIARYRESIALIDTPETEAGLAATLMRAGQTAQARAAAEKALDRAQAAASRPDASEADLRRATRLLLEAPFPELKNPVLAQRYALEAVAVTKDNDPLTLDLLAQTYAASGGHVAWAVATEQKALAVLPAGHPALRARLQRNLETYARGIGH